MFQQHSLSVENFSWEKVLAHNNQMTLVLCVILLLLTVVVLTSRRKLTLIVKSLFSQRHFSLIQREGGMLKDKNAIALLLFDVLAISAGITQFSSVYIPNFLAGFPLIAKIGFFSAPVLAAYFLKSVLYQLYSSLFDRKRELALISQYKIVFATDFAIALFPLIVAIQYTGLKFIFYIITAILCILCAVWIYRLVKIKPGNGNLFHFFLYFCALEIMPWLLLVKFMLKF